MFYLLIDTCVWLDLAKDHKQKVLLSVIEELVEMEELTLLVPRTVTEEFLRNKDRIVAESKKSVLDNFNRVIDSVNKFGDPNRTQIALDQLSEVAHKIPLLGDVVAESVGRIISLFNAAILIETSDKVKLAAAERAIHLKAPFHLNKNSFNDAIIFETYLSALNTYRGKMIRFSFVTHNTKDFGLSGTDHRLPHPDLAKGFSKIKSLYFINLAEAIHRIRPDLVTEMMLELEWNQEPRGLTEIYDAENELREKIWYNRHQNWLHKIQIGEHKIVRKSSHNYKVDETPLEIFKGAREAAKRVEKKYGKKNLGPWDDFEWGMMNGKLSALRWVTGEEWDFLDT